MTYLLDTDHISILQRQDGEEFRRLSGRIAQAGMGGLLLCVVSLHEQVLGCHAYINRARTPDAIVRGYAMLGRVFRAFTAAPVLPFDEAAVASFEVLSARRLRVATMDLRIAAIAVSRGLTLLTRNRSDFGQIAELTIQDWTV